MALDILNLKKDIKDLLTEERKKEDDGASSIDNIASQLAAAIEKFVKSGTVTTTVTTTGSASAQTGTGTGKIT
ncbi:hypothetical protein OIU83_01775 [Flavobacterium sp. LS1R49]|uniref:Uncharacterized protein n=1 Tax=Flavobacterium shii TaxID=2987687 RepID=A0A9X2Z982_9FLAO|nr:hypothetical protein [Flavobacterium shii]MCV9926364.1 hypothetical protein [Flavobacterium shii]